MYKTFVLALVMVIALRASPLRAQPVSFESIDSDANGGLSPSEFANLPRSYGTWQVFSEMDVNLDGIVSRAEWQKGALNSADLRGAATAAPSRDAKPVPPPRFLPHGRSVPRQKVEEVDLENLPPKQREEWPVLSGRAGAAGAKQGVPLGALQAEPDEPPAIAIPPRQRR